MAQDVMNELKFDYKCQYDPKDSIGKRYRRQDAVGTPFCVTIDHESLNGGCVTLRERDSMEQRRIPVAELRAVIDKEVNMNNLLRTL
jgi:glycyl-tRNA synthetase